MLKFWLYILVLIAVCILGLSIGSANDVPVTFDFLFVKTEISLGMVLVIGIIAGMVIGLYMASWFCLKVWFKSRGSKATAKRLQKQNTSLTHQLEAVKARGQEQGSER